MKTSILLTGVLLCTNVTLAEESGKELFNTLCLSCHTINPNKGITKVAPPIFAVIKHVKSAYPQREDFVQQIIDWVEYPDGWDDLI
jgi:cytochrome c2